MYEQIIQTNFKCSKKLAILIKTINLMELLYFRKIYQINKKIFRTFRSRCIRDKKESFIKKVLKKNYGMFCFSYIDLYKYVIENQKYIVQRVKYWNCVDSNNLTQLTEVETDHDMRKDQRLKFGQYKNEQNDLELHIYRTIPTIYTHW